MLRENASRSCGRWKCNLCEGVSDLSPALGMKERQAPGGLGLALGICRALLHLNPIDRNRPVITALSWN
jgi:hypothetical protein